MKHIWFRKNLKLDAKPGNVFIHVASLGHHELYVNGRKADDRVLAPAMTNLNKRIFYVTYDLSELLKKGDNKSFADFNIYNVFISSGKDGETFSNRFNYIAGRYANVRGLRQAPKPEDATAYAYSRLTFRAYITY